MRQSHPELSPRSFSRLIGVPYWKLRDFVRREHQTKARERALHERERHVERLALAHPTYGYRRLTRELRTAGVKVGLEYVGKTLGSKGLNPPPARKRRKAALPVVPACCCLVA